MRAICPNCGHEQEVSCEGFANSRGFSIPKGAEFNVCPECEQITFSAEQLKQLEQNPEWRASCEEIAEAKKNKDWLSILPQHGTTGGYFAIDALPKAWACFENMSRPNSDFLDDPAYINNCMSLEFAVDDLAFAFNGPLMFAREMYDPELPTNKGNYRTDWMCGPENEFYPYGANFYSMQTVSEIRSGCLERATAQAQAAKTGCEVEGELGQGLEGAKIAGEPSRLAEFYAEFAERLGAMLELDWDKYIVCFYGP